MHTARYYRSRWWMPAFSLFLGLLMLAAFWIGGSLADGLVALGVVIIGAFLVDVARGGDGNPYGLLGAVAGVAYIASVAILRARS
jgi:hypothetical protein